MIRIILELPTISLKEIDNNSNVGILFNHNKYIIGCTGQIYHLCDVTNYQPVFVKVRDLYSTKEVIEHMLQFTKDIFMFHTDSELRNWYKNP